MPKVAFVTALFNINRQNAGDGRTFDKYIEWLQTTVALPVDMVFFVDPKYGDDVRKARENAHLTNQFVLIEHTLDKVPYFSQVERIREAQASDKYKMHMRDLARIECYHPEYIIAIFSKFYFLNQAASSKMLNADAYFWIDAGAGRYIGPESTKIERTIPSGLADKFALHVTPDYHVYDAFAAAEWDNHSIIRAWFFGGIPKTIQLVTDLVSTEFNKMVDMGAPNNEQIALALVSKLHPAIFRLYTDELSAFEATEKQVAKAFEVNLSKDDAELKEVAGCSCARTQSMIEAKERRTAPVVAIVAATFVIMVSILMGLRWFRLKKYRMLHNKR